MYLTFILYFITFVLMWTLDTSEMYGFVDPIHGQNNFANAQA